MDPQYLATSNIMQEFIDSSFPKLLLIAGELVKSHRFLFEKGAAEVCGLFPKISRAF